MAALDFLLDTSVGIAVITGIPGIGKSSLAVHWAHTRSLEFPDGRLYVNLQGFDPVIEPVAPSSVMRGFLEDLGISPDRQPQSDAGRIALFRSTLATRRMLILLDNARDVGQVRDLLPASTNSKVIITSRNRLLPIKPYKAFFVDLRLPEPNDAAEFFAKLINTAISDQVRASIESIVRSCGRLPLAMSIVASQLEVRPALTLSDIAEEIRATGSNILDELDTGDELTSVRPVFSWSYRILSEPESHQLRMITLAPGASIGVDGAASAANVSRTEAVRTLTNLFHWNLIDEITPRRYGMHDLLRQYYRERLAEDSDESARRFASIRILDFYLHNSYQAERILYPKRDGIDIAESTDGVVIVEPRTYEEAIKWFNVERENIISAIGFATSLGYNAYAWKIAWCMTTYLDRRAYWGDYARTQEIAVSAATEENDEAARALTHRLLATALTRLGEFHRAETSLQISLDIYTRINDLAGQGRTYFNLAHCAERQGDYSYAVELATKSLELYRSDGHTVGTARIVSWLGWYQAKTHQYPAAIASCREAIAMFELEPNPWEHAHAIHHLGYALAHVNEPDAAVDYFTESVEMLARLDDDFSKANVLVDLGNSEAARGNDDLARNAWAKAASIFEELGHHQLADDLKVRISGVDDAGS
ncbi:MAG: tetratricopeptide repeat protein [Mycolicibacterium rufum]|nr:tetratricopeptide repeat protein [Mycolicibacterium rufum]